MPSQRKLNVAYYLCELAGELVLTKCKMGMMKIEMFAIFREGWTGLAFKTPR